MNNNKYCLKNVDYELDSIFWVLGSVGCKRSRFQTIVRNLPWIPNNFSGNKQTNNTHHTHPFDNFTLLGKLWKLPALKKRHLNLTYMSWAVRGNISCAWQEDAIPGTARYSPSGLLPLAPEFHGQPSPLCVVLSCRGSAAPGTACATGNEAGGTRVICSLCYTPEGPLMSKISLDSSKSAPKCNWDTSLPIHRSLWSSLTTTTKNYFNGSKNASQ